MNDRVGVEAEVPIKIGHRPGLAEMLDAECLLSVAMDASKPGQRRRVPIDH